MSRAGINLNNYSPSKKAILGEENTGKDFFSDVSNTQESKKEEKPQEIPKTTLQTLKKQFKNQTLIISTKNLARLKIITELQHITQATYLDNLLEEHFTKQNFDEEMLKLIDNETDKINLTLKSKSKSN